jgi:hypothetical protein
VVSSVFALRQIVKKVKRVDMADVQSLVALRMELKAVLWICIISSLVLIPLQGRMTTQTIFTFAAIFFPRITTRLCTEKPHSAIGIGSISESLMRCSPRRNRRKTSSFRQQRQIRSRLCYSWCEPTLSPLRSSSVTPPL